MRSPFPGMDPYLEAPEVWPEVHSRLSVAIADQLGEQLSDPYRVAIEKRIYIDGAEADLTVGIPDISVVTQRADLGFAGGVGSGLCMGSSTLGCRLHELSAASSQQGRSRMDKATVQKNQGRSIWIPMICCRRAPMARPKIWVVNKIKNMRDRLTN